MFIINIARSNRNTIFLNYTLGVVQMSKMSTTIMMNIFKRNYIYIHIYNQSVQNIFGVS